MIKFSYLFFLIAFILFLSGATSQHIGSYDKHKTPTADVKNSSDIPPKDSSFQTDFIEALRSIANEYKTASEQNHADQENWCSPSVLVSVGLFVVGAIYSIFAYLQWLAIKHQADIIDRNFTISERAWVMVSFKIPYSPEDESLSFFVVNVGKTPAFIKDIKIVEWKLINGQELVTDLSGRPETPLTISPGEKLQRVQDTKFDPEISAQLRNKTKRLIFAGMVTYDDIFHKPHYTRFYVMYSPDVLDGKGGFVIPPDIKPGQNEAT